MSSSNPTWEEIQANFSRQQYLPQLQSRVRPQQQQHQAQQHQPQQQLPNQYGSQMLQGQQFVAQQQVQNAFTGSFTMPFQSQFFTYQYT